MKWSPRSSRSSTLFAGGAAGARAGARRTSGSGSGSRRRASTAGCRPTASGWPTASPARTARTSCASRASPTARTKTIAFGAQPAFSADSKLARGFGRRVRGAAGQACARTRSRSAASSTLLNLSAGEITTLDGVESFAFSADGQQLLIRRYAPERRRGGRGDAGSGGRRSIRRRPRASPPSSAICDGPRHHVRQRRRRRSGRRRGACSRSRSPPKIARATASRSSIRGPARCGCSTPAPARYLGLAWRKDADDLVVLKSKSERTTRRTHVSDPRVDRRRHRRLRRSTSTIPPAIADSAAAGASSHSAARRGRTTAVTVFVGVAAWAVKAPAAKKDKDGDPFAATTVDVWHAHDVAVMPKQKIDATRDRQRSLLAAWTIDAPALTVLGHDFTKRSCRSRSTTSPTPSTGRTARSIAAGAASVTPPSRSSTSRRVSARSRGSRRRRHISPSPDGKAPALFRGRSDLHDRHRAENRRQRLEDRADVVRRHGVGLDRRAEGVLRRRRLDEGRAGTCSSTTSTTSGRWRPTARRRRS